MKPQTLFLLIVGSIPLLVLTTIDIADIIGVLQHPHEYPFGSEFHSAFSLYRSKTIYLSYQMISTLLLLITIFLLFKRKWKPFKIVLAIDIILLVLPLFLT